MGEVARSVFGDTCTESQRSSIALAVRNLELRGLVGTYWDGGEISPVKWCTSP
jgi:hypothetical protein